jgi:arginyl-tRNA synthetase
VSISDQQSPQGSVAHALAEVISTAVSDGTLSGEQAKKIAAAFAEGKYENLISLERPKNRDHGDYASSISLSLAKSEGKKPIEIANLIKDGLSLENYQKVFADVAIAGPGFINLTLNKSSQGAIVNRILNEKKEFGKVKVLEGTSINLEFISANPTGPLHLGHTRWAAVGDALASVLAAAGAKVTREFYINDRGNQMDLFGASIRAAVLGIARPEDGFSRSGLCLAATTTKRCARQFWNSF